MKEITKEEIREIVCESLSITITNLHGTTLGISGIDETVDKIYSVINQPEPKKFEVWKPEIDETYYYMDSFGDAIKDVSNLHSYDTQRIEIGNCFKTEQEALNHVAHLKAKKKLQDELAVMNAEANGGVEYVENDTQYLNYGMATNTLAVNYWKSDYPIHNRIRANYQTTIGTLTEEEVKLAFGVFE